MNRFFYFFLLHYDSCCEFNNSKKTFFNLQKPNIMFSLSEQNKYSLRQLERWIKSKTYYQNLDGTQSCFHGWFLVDKATATEKHKVIYISWMHTNTTVRMEFTKETLPQQQQFSESNMGAKNVPPSHPSKKKKRCVNSLNNKTNLFPVEFIW